MNEFANAQIVEFPLRGEWMTPNTPGTKIPSHGTDQLGQRYAFDLFQVDWGKKGRQFFNANKLRYYFLGVPLDKCLLLGARSPGNYIIMECANNVFAFFAHLQNASITVSAGDKVKKGQIIGRVGHSGNSTARICIFSLWTAAIH